MFVFKKPYITFCVAVIVASSVWSSASMLRDMDSLWVHSILKSTRWVSEHRGFILILRKKQTKWTSFISSFSPESRLSKVTCLTILWAASSSWRGSLKGKCGSRWDSDVPFSDHSELVLLVQKWFYLYPQQNVYSGEKYGAVTLLTSYRRSDHRLRVEVLNAVNLLPMDSNGNNTQNRQNMCVWQLVKGKSNHSKFLNIDLKIGNCTFPVICSLLDFRLNHLLL